MRSLLAAGLLLFALTAFAADHFACPAWEIFIVDDRGQPVPGFSVLQEWGARSGAQFTNASASALTDAAGRAAFPARQIRPAREKNPLKKMGRLIDGEKATETWANVFVGSASHKGIWIRAWNDPLIVSTTNGFRSRVTLKRDK